jgi:hypothetical protein
MINDMLDGHVVLDLERLDRIYLNVYVPNLQVGGQVVTFLTRHLGNPIPSPALFDKIGTVFRKSVAVFAEDNHIPVVRFGKNDRKIEIMRPYLDAQAATGRSGVAAIGLSQPAGHVLLLLPLGPRLRSCVHQDLCLLPLSGQDLDQRARVGQTASGHGRYPVHRTVQRVRRHRRPGRVAGHL